MDLLLIIGALGALLVSGCVTLTDDGTFNTVRAMTKERLGYEPRWARTEADFEYFI